MWHIHRKTPSLERPIVGSRREGRRFKGKLRRADREWAGDPSGLSRVVRDPSRDDIDDSGYSPLVHAQANGSGAPRSLQESAQRMQGTGARLQGCTGGSWSSPWPSLLTWLPSSDVLNLNGWPLCSPPVLCTSMALRDQEGGLLSWHAPGCFLQKSLLRARLTPTTSHHHHLPLSITGDGHRAPGPLTLSPRSNYKVTVPLCAPLLSS